MGTNYYIVDDGNSQGIHVGKRSSIGGGDMIFTWAVNPGSLEGCETFLTDEYGKRFGPREFTEMLLKCSERDYSFIGTEFS